MPDPATVEHHPVVRVHLAPELGRLLRCVLAAVGTSSFSFPPFVPRRSHKSHQSVTQPATTVANAAAAAIIVCLVHLRLILCNARVLKAECIILSGGSQPVRELQRCDLAIF